ncbi:IS630 family transposase [Orientia tsutsugamushi]|uniref:IS630 family transposase n=1 Tax=Orientia tsutsugamushi TaxID=784 RepID=A0A2U3RMH7_ORITS|nr:DDE superendonuclease family protein [Orientia tsutsugamushi str. Karp]SPR14439.1 IS630 family transposase [Orientia tsutsugamushi]
MRCYGILASIKKTNVIGALVDKLLLTISIFDCNVNTAIFNCWIEQDLIPKLHNNSVVVMDNATFHKSLHLKTMIEKDIHIWFNYRNNI